MVETDGDGFYRRDDGTIAGIVLQKTPGGAITTLNGDAIADNFTSDGIQVRSDFIQNAKSGSIVYSSPPVDLPDPADVAARPDVPKQSGGRGGVNVKDLKGPPNSAIPANNDGGGRIYITDENGNVIADVDSERIKTVIPGRGFMSGSKQDVPQGYLDLIN